MNHSFRSVPNSPTENHQFASSSAGSSARNFQHQTSADSDSRPRRQGSQGGFVGTSSGLFGGNSEPANKNTNPIYGQGSVLESITGSISESVHDILSSGSQLFSDQRRQLFSNSDSTPYSFVSNMVKVMNKQCSSCTNTFTLFLRKKRCHICQLCYCASCVESSTSPRMYRCKRCIVFTSQPLTKEKLNTLRVRDLKWFLDARYIPSNTYSEKRELVDLVYETVTSQTNLFGPSTSTFGNTSQARSVDPQPSSPRATPSSSVDDFVMIPEPGERLNSSPQNFPSTSTNPEPVFQPPSSEPFSPSTSNLANRADRASTSDLSSSQSNLSMFSIDDIKDEEEIRTLSARQLKLLLARSFVDFKGCVEREELVKKAVLLYNDKKANQLKENDLDEYTLDENTCKICMERIVDCVLLECGHMLTCTACGKILTECPICRQFVSRVVHVFKA